MNLFSIVFAADFNQSRDFALEDNKADFLNYISRGTFDTRKLPHLGINVNDTQTKTIVVLEEKKIAIAVEQDDIRVATERLLEVLGYIYQNYSFSEKTITRIGLRTQWQHEWGSSFTKLCKKYKEIYYKDIPLIKEAADVGVNLTLSDHEFRVNYISGPMKKEQGQDLLTFKDRHLPHDFIFVDLDRNKLGQHENTFESIKNFIATSIEYEQNKAQETVNIF